MCNISDIKPSQALWVKLRVNALGDKCNELLVYCGIAWHSVRFCV